MHRPSIAMLSCALILAACSSEKPRELTLADIRFPDPEREAIVANGIADMDAYDTAEYFKKYPDAREKFGRSTIWNGDTLYSWGYCLESRQYDSSGNRTYYWRNDAMMMMCGYGIYPNMVYDSSGRIIYNWKRERAYHQDTFWYYLDTPANIFVQAHSSGKGWNKSKDTTWYSIDDRGRPLKGTHYSRYWNDTGWHYSSFDTTWYTYSEGRLDKKLFHYKDANNNTYDRDVIERYFYKRNKLDSMSSLEYYPHKRWKMRDIHEYIKYDERGLPLRGLIADSLHVYYRFKKHGDPSIPDYSDW